MSGSAPYPILYSFRRCPYAMRARLALLASGQRCELREVVLRDKPAALRAVSPKATVPVVVLSDRQVIDQSLDIMLWALRQNDPQGCLGPEEAWLAPALVWIERCDGDFKQHLDRYKYPHRYALPNGFANQAQAAGFLSDLNDSIETQGCLLGATRSLADLAIAPFVRQFANTDPAWFAAQPWPALQAWLAQFEASPLFLQTMFKFSPWTSGQTPQVFPSADILLIQ